MKELEMVVNLENAKSDSDVFNAFNKTFQDELKTYQWKIASWDGLDDFLWGYIQGPYPNDPVSYPANIEKINIKVINAKHLINIRTQLRIQNSSILQALRDSFSHIQAEQKKRTTSDDLSVFRNSTFEIVN